MGSFFIKAELNKYKFQKINTTLQCALNAAKMLQKVVLGFDKHLC